MKRKIENKFKDVWVVKEYRPAWDGVPAYWATILESDLETCKQEYPHAQVEMKPTSPNWENTIESFLSKSLGNW